MPPTGYQSCSRSRSSARMTAAGSARFPNRRVCSLMARARIMATLPDRLVGLEDDPLWYKDAIIYEVHVSTFYDSDGDGIGDFSGLTQKLDYLQDLGVTVLWLLPFYPSPLKDDGYDISDY